MLEEDRKKWEAKETDLKLMETSREILQNLFVATQDYERGTHGLLFALGRLVTRKQPNVKLLDLERDEFVKFAWDLILAGAEYQIAVGHGDYGALLLEPKK